MNKQNLYIALIVIACLIAGVGFIMAFQQKDKTVATQHPTSQAVAKAIIELADQEQAKQKAVAQKQAEEEKKIDYTTSGTLRDTEGQAMADVIVSDGYTCVKTDSMGHYEFKRNKLARFIYYSVPADCEVPTHSETDRTACFYQPVKADQKEYDFTLTRLPEGKEKKYKMIVIGDPQVTNAFSPYYIMK